MRIRRILWFMVSIAVGLGAGLLYGWMFSPGSYADTGPDSLRVDYKTDLVLMVAEIYQRDGDAAAATARLEGLDDLPPVRQVQNAILNGQELGFARADIETLARLFQGLQTMPPATREATP